MCSGVKGQKGKEWEGKRGERWRVKGKHNGGGEHGRAGKKRQESKGGRTEWGRMGEDEEE